MTDDNEEDFTASGSSIWYEDWELTEEDVKILLRARQRMKDNPRLKIVSRVKHIEDDK